MRLSPERFADLLKRFNQAVSSAVRQNHVQIRRNFEMATEIVLQSRRQSFGARRRLEEDFIDYVASSIQLNRDAFLRYWSGVTEEQIRKNSLSIPNGLIFIETRILSVQEELKSLVAGWEDLADDQDEIVRNFRQGLLKSNDLLLSIASVCLRDLLRIDYYSAKIPIFRDDGRSVRFSKVGHHLSPEKGAETTDTKDDAVLVENALNDLMQHLHTLNNRDHRMYSIIKEYIETFRSGAPTRELLLYLIWVKVREHLKDPRFEGKEGETEEWGIPPDVIKLINVLGVAHQGYIWTFPRVVAFVDRRRQTLASLGSDERQAYDAQLEISRNFSASTKIFDHDGRQSFEQVADVASTVQIGHGKQETNRAVYAIMRAFVMGGLQAMAQIVVISTATVATVAVAVMGNAVTNALEPTPLYKNIVAFIAENDDILLRLAKDIPDDYAWLVHLLGLVKQMF